MTLASPLHRGSTNEATPLDRWLSQALRHLFDPVLHETLPSSLTSLLPPAEPGESRPIASSRLRRS